MFSDTALQVSILGRYRRALRTHNLAGVQLKDSAVYCPVGQVPAVRQKEPLSYFSAASLEHPTLIERFGDTCSRSYLNGKPESVSRKGRNYRP